MSGRGDNLTDVIRKELASLFAPVAGKKPLPVNLTMPAHVTYYDVSPDCPVNDVLLTQPAPETREALGDFAVSEFASNYPLLPVEARLNTIPCVMQPVLCAEPVFQSKDTTVHHISFADMATRQSHGIPLPKWSAPTRPLAARPCATSVRAIQPGHFHIRQQSRQVSIIKGKARDVAPGLWGLPISRTPIPPHRFPAAMKDRFRKTLAEKAGVAAAGIQIRLVFDRMNMVLFEKNIEQDKQGRLLCYPKSRYIGKNWERYHHEVERLPMYLVFGTVIGTSQNVQALVSGIEFET